MSITFSSDSTIINFSRFKQLINLGRKLLKTNPELHEVRDLIDRLEAEQAAIARGWKEKEHWLQQCLRLQEFNKEADNIDAVTSAHMAFLEFSDLGVSFFSGKQLP